MAVDKCAWCGDEVEYLPRFWDHHYVLDAQLICEVEDK